MADVKKIKVGSTIYDIKDATKLPKVTYEWNKEFAAGSNGAISLGRYNIYDSQLTFDITSTTNQSLSGKLVIATQNGTIHQAKVFGDASGTLVSKLIIYQSAISNSRSWVEVFCNFNGWSKNKVHIYAVALNSATVQKQMTSVTISNGVPAEANVTSGDTKWTGAIVNDFNHSHGISIATSSGTNKLTLAHGTKYALTAGGQSFIFTTPNDNNTHNSHAIISGTKSDNSTQIKGSASSGDITLGDSGVTAGDYGDTTPQTPDYNAAFKVPSISVNAKGIVTAIGEHTVTIPDSSYLVPYMGANDHVNLGKYSLISSDKITNGIRVNSVSPDGFHAAFDRGDDGNTDNTYYSVYRYDGITHNNKKLLFPEKDGTIALTSDIPSKLSQMDNDANYVKSTDNIDADTLDGKTYSQIADMIGQKQKSTAFLGLIADTDVSGGKTGFLRVYMKAIEAPGLTKYTQVAELQNLPLASSSEYGMVKLVSDVQQSTAANPISSTASRTYAIQKDSSEKLVVNVPWTRGNIDTSLSSSSTDPLQNKAIYSAFSSAVGYDNIYYAYGENGSWRMRWYNQTANSLDIKYGVITINSQSANYSVSFSGKNFTSTNYTVVFGLYRSNTQSWFWSPIVQSKTTSGFTVFLRGNSGGDNGGTLMYLAIRSN